MGLPMLFLPPGFPEVTLAPVNHDTKCDFWPWVPLVAGGQLLETERLISLCRKQRTRIKMRERLPPFCSGNSGPNLHRDTFTVSCEPPRGFQKSVSTVHYPKDRSQVRGRLMGSEKSFLGPQWTLHNASILHKLRGALLHKAEGRTKVRFSRR